MKNYAVLLILLWAQYTWAECRDSHNITQYIKKADSLLIHHDTTWLRLLHYENADIQAQSDVDGGNFFLSPLGKFDSQSELHRNIEGLLCDQNLTKMDQVQDSLDFHPVCRFPARKSYLQNMLSIPDSLFPEYTCVRYNEWKKKLSVNEVTIVFASSYMNNPASMFGHTFLRLDKLSNRNRKKMLNYAVNYGATQTDGPGIFYVLNGLFGGYRGMYSIFPYYVSIQNYANMEQRDMWEYTLDLDDSQLSFLVDHIWEMGDTWMDYYFFDENCSYNILTLLDILNPQWKLSDKFPIFAIPVETLKSINSVPGLVKEISFRPSLFSKMYHNFLLLNDVEEEVLTRVMESDTIDLRSLIEAKKVDTTSFLRVVDLGLDYIQMKKRKSQSVEEISSWGKKQRSLLLQRIGFKGIKSSYVKNIPIDSTKYPHGSHLPYRIAGESGMMHFNPYLGVNLRMSYHDENSDETGLLNGVTVETLVAKVRGRKTKSGWDLGLYSLTGFHIQALLPHNAFFNPWSWRFNIAIDTRKGSKAFKNSLYSEVGAGKTFTMLKNKIWVYGLLECKIRAASWYSYYVNAGPQSRLGVRLRLKRWLSYTGWGTYFYPLIGEKVNEFVLFNELRFNISPKSEVRLRSVVNDTYGEGGIEWGLYF
ncbi:MAG: DUF4105 domain-containing protein [Fibrobacterales bacterium]